MVILGLNLLCSEVINKSFFLFISKFVTCFYRFTLIMVIKIFLIENLYFVKIIFVWFTNKIQNKIGFKSFRIYRR